MQLRDNCLLSSVVSGQSTLSMFSLIEFLCSKVDIQKICCINCSLMDVNVNLLFTYLNIIVKMDHLCEMHYRVCFKEKSFFVCY